MTKGLLVKCADLEKVKTEVVLFNGQHWYVEGMHARRFVTFFAEGKPSKVFFQSKETDEIYDSIKLIKNEKGLVIAQRLNMNCRLLTTRDYKHWDITNPKNRALEVYALIMAIEEKEYAAEMQRYWYQERKKEA